MCSRSRASAPSWATLWRTLSRESVCLSFPQPSRIKNMTPGPEPSFSLTFYKCLSFCLVIPFIMMEAKVFVIFCYSLKWQELENIKSLTTHRSVFAILTFLQHLVRSIFSTWYVFVTCISKLCIVTCYLYAHIPLTQKFHRNI